MKEQIERELREISTYIKLIETIDQLSKEAFETLEVQIKLISLRREIEANQREIEASIKDADDWCPEAGRPAHMRDENWD